MKPRRKGPQNPQRLRNTVQNNQIALPIYLLLYHVIDSHVLHLLCIFQHNKLSRAERELGQNSMYRLPLTRHYG